jgi:hypothetical protein
MAGTLLCGKIGVGEDEAIHKVRLNALVWAGSAEDDGADEETDRSL